MWNALIRTDNDLAPLVLRLALGGVILPHGMQKVFGWFGGGGFVGTVQHFTEGMGIPLIIALLVIVAEFFGSLALLAGFLTRLAAFGIACVMTGAIFIVHWENGFFMNWSGKQAGEGFEYHLLAIGLALGLMVKGGGAFSVDRKMQRRR